MPHLIADFCMTISRRSTVSAVSLTVIGALLASTLGAREEGLFPALFDMNQSIDEARPRIEAACARTSVLQYTGAMAAPYEHQTQIDCFDLLVMGKPRKVEFMFNEGYLEFLWILLERAELDVVEAKFREVYGDVVFANGNYKVFADGAIALRSEPAEILIGTAELVQEITGYRP
ncbi:MAG: hypothetical protein OER22_15510 [Gammaproteobacteria bacterium]|nr:hypothetical protein [Gammaproteobacteria bacterium]MDH3374894.1 hypothetical protein [Gammaproteobacteria bacterium]MDH3409967.1 hypothetical protein [Gammaproteobacteria bacterium]MDH3554017.1 hypothetical protein [Gammaproteobacteria bacterium]